MISNTLIFLQLQLQATPQNSLLWIHLWPDSGLPGCLTTFSDVAVPVKTKLMRGPAEAQSFSEPFLYSTYSPMGLS